jgi:hypothetical protein
MKQDFGFAAAVERVYPWRCTDAFGNVPAAVRLLARWADRGFGTRTG